MTAAAYLHHLARLADLGRRRRAACLCLTAAR
jgi:hypothetical protein